MWATAGRRGNSKSCCFTTTISIIWAEGRKVHEQGSKL
jgi:hypothetical protein